MTNNEYVIEHIVKKKLFFFSFLPPHIYDGEYDDKLPKIKLTSKNMKVENLKYVMCNAFGFGGTNTVIILGK